MSAGASAIIAIRVLSTGRINKRRNVVPTPVQKIIKSIGRNNPNINFPRLVLAGIK